MFRCGDGSEDRGKIGDNQFGQKRRGIGDSRFGLNVQFGDAESTEGQAEERAVEEAPTPRQQGELGKAARADKPTKRVDALGIKRVKERERGVKPEETGAKNRKSGKNLMLSLRGSVEIPAQHWPDWLRKPSNRSV